MGDVDLAAREITVQHGKGDKMRVVFIGDKVVKAIKEYLQNRPDSFAFRYLTYNRFAFSFIFSRVGFV